MMQTILSMRALALLLIALMPRLATSQASLHASTERRQWTLDAGEMTYVLGVNDQQMLQSLYWGPRLTVGATLPTAKAQPPRASFDSSINTTPLEYVGWGAGLYTEPDLKIDSPDGNRSLILKFSDVHIEGNRLEVVLKDATEPVAVHLFYEPYPGGILARWSRIENLGSKPLHIGQAASATWNLPQGKGYEWSWLTGIWAAEWQLHTAPIYPGTQLIESRRGSTSHQANPWFAVKRTGETTESNGPVWFGELGWSGSWRMTVEDSAQDNVRITAGLNPFDFESILAPGQSLSTPQFYAGYTHRGNGEASRILHRFQRAVILPTHPEPKPRPIIYNSWEATGFGVTEEGQLQLAQKAAQLGIERFVIDDGWFGQRNNDHSSLGDWTVNTKKFPNGLKPMIDHVHALGMQFGLWVEPEMVSPDSDLYRAHPDWAMSFPNRQRTEMRNQLVLNLAKPEVKDYIFQAVDRLVTDNDIAFLKWDYNRNWTEPGWDSSTADGAQDQKEIYVRYILNLYEILDKLRRKHPGLEIESCSGGGGRVDLGILKYTDEVWPSDNTDALDRLTLQDGFTQAYSPQIMAAWVTDAHKRSIPLEFRFLVSMQGALGVGGNLNHWSVEDMADGKRYIDLYKSVRNTLQSGDLYRLQSPRDGDASQVEYVSRDGSQVVLLAYLHSQHYSMQYPTVRLEGLDPNATYVVHPLDAAKYHGELEVKGSLLMGAGVHISLIGDYDSTSLVLDRKTER